MCPVPRTNKDSVDTNGNAASVAADSDPRFFNRHMFYNDREETSAFQLSQVDVDWSMKLNRNLAANCRNISDEVFPGIHLGDR